ncbi:hypothetical protein CL629_04655 [bacterium]|nr:hypothetical protein [bacterium]|tara:strand:+ start:3298 stop:3993 length:696 start_codon:yes stop_codon:yes gene_type:complete
MPSYNSNIAYITISAGAGGDDAKDWAKMLFRMYQKYADKKNWKKRLINENTVEIKGENAYKRLKDESGVHRLVRISPFDSKRLRHTSFALVEVLPEVEGIEAGIPQEDLKVEFFRSSAPGGQNVNKVETAVRAIHLPTGLKAGAQTERSQSANRERAVKLLKAKLAKLLEERKEKEISNLRVKVEPDWGHEIRSYVLHPYKMVKDHETKKKSGKVEEFLGGDIDILFKKKK